MTSVLQMGTAMGADASRFDGVYGGVFIGLGGVAYEGVIDSSHLPGDPGQTETFSGDWVSGLVGGAYAGINVAVDEMVFGVEASVSGGLLEARVEDFEAND